MTKYVWFAFLLFIACGVIAVLGAVLVRRRALHLKSGKRFAQLGALGVAVVAYGLMQTARFSLPLDAVNTAAFLLAVSVAAYAVVWTVLAFTINSSGYGQEASDSSIFTKMFPDTALHKPDFESTQLLRPKDRK
jgi:hypothetical protein